MDITSYDQFVPAANYVVPTGLNGLFGKPDLARPVDRIDAANKIVVDEGGSFDIVGTIAYALMEKQGFPSADAQLSTSGEAIRGVMDKISIRMSQHVLLSAVGVFRADVQLSSRPSDYVTSVIAAGMPHWAEALDAARKVVAYADADDAFRDVLFEMSKNTVLCLAANAIHREQHDGHNWFSSRSEDTRTLTGRTVAIAAGDREGFASFMRDWGHDLWHFLSHDSLRAIANLIMGEDNEPNAFTINYGGTEYQAGTVSMTAMVNLGESCTDRWPVSELGKASLITGIDAIHSMLTAIVSKVNMPEVADIAGACTSLRNVITNVELGRDTVVAVRSAMTPVIVTAFGFKYADPMKSNDKGEVPALEKLASRNKVHSDVGALLYRHWSEMATDPGAVGSLLAKAVSDVSLSVSSTTEAIRAGPNMENALRPHAPRIAAVPRVAQTASEKAAEQQAAMMRLMSGRAAVAQEGAVLGMNAMTPANVGIQSASARARTTVPTAVPAANARAEDRLAPRPAARYARPIAPPAARVRPPVQAGAQNPVNATPGTSSRGAEVSLGPFRPRTETTSPDPIRPQSTSAIGSEAGQTTGRIYGLDPSAPTFRSTGLFSTQGPSVSDVWSASQRQPGIGSQEIPTGDVSDDDQSESESEGSELGTSGSTVS